MKYIKYLPIIIMLIMTGCKKKICGRIETVGRDLGPMGKERTILYLETGEKVEVAQTELHPGDAFCND